MLTVTMLSYICEFDLKQSGEDANAYLASAAREWPALWGAIPGVKGTLLLSNAFGLGGGFGYQWRVDLESFGALQAIDDALKSKAPEWQRVRKAWFENRSKVQARILRGTSGTASSYCHNKSGQEGLIHYVLSWGNSADKSAGKSAASDLNVRAPEVVAKVKGVLSHETRSVALGNAKRGTQELWVRLESLGALDELHRAHDSHIGDLLRDNGAAGQLFGEIREVNGSLLVGA